MSIKADIRRARYDCFFFGQRYFPHLLTQPSSQFHRALITAAEDGFHDRISILAPRGHAKSTWLSIIYPVWKIVRNRDIKIIIVSDTGEQAEMFLGEIRHELEANERLLADFGAFRPEAANRNWKASSITVERPSPAKEPTVYACGTGTRIVGRRADLVIVDDPLNDENTENERQRLKTLRWFRKTLTPILNPKTGRMVVIGTRKHPDDLHRVLGSNPRYIQYVFRSMDGDVVLWKERWPRARLLREKEEIGSLVFAQEYQNDPVSEETAFFRREWVEHCWDHGAVLGARAPKGMPVFTGWDLALVADKARAAERDSDYTAGITIALGDDGTRHVLDIFRERGLTPAQVLESIQSRAAQFQPALITLETTLFQSLYEDRLISETDLPVAGHATGKEKMDVFTGVPSLSVLFENRKYRLPRGDEHSAALCDALTNELVGLGIERHDDLVMALWIAECGIRRQRERAARIEVIDDPT